MEIIEQGWLQVKVGAIDKLQNFLKTRDSKVMFSKKEYMQYYSIVYNLCTIKYEHAQQLLYGKFSDSIKEYLETNVKCNLE